MSMPYVGAFMFCCSLIHKMEAEVVEFRDYVRDDLSRASNKL